MYVCKIDDNKIRIAATEITTNKKKMLFRKIKQRQKIYMYMPLRLFISQNTH